MKLYRFEKAESKRVRTVSNNQIRMSLPKTFNDLFDCKQLCIYRNDRFSTLEERVKAAAVAMYTGNDDHSYFLNKDFIDGVFDWCKTNQIGSPSFVKSFIRNIEKIGIQCFTECDYKNPIMWAHYGERNTGFCIEYELATHRNSEFNGLSEGFQRANYTSQRIELDYKEILFCPDIAAIRYITHKSTEWAYEKEWRLIYPPKISDSENNGGYIIDLPNFLRVTGIFLGPRFDSDSELLIDLKNCAKKLEVPLNRICIDPFTIELDIDDELV